MITASAKLTQLTDIITLRPATLDDLPETVALFNLCAREVIGKDEFSLDDIRTEWSDPGLDLATDVRVAHTADGAIVGYVEVWSAAPYVASWIWGRVHPAYRGQG